MGSPTLLCFGSDKRCVAAYPGDLKKRQPIRSVVVQSALATCSVDFCRRARRCTFVDARRFTTPQANTRHNTTNVYLVTLPRCRMFLRPSLVIPYNQNLVVPLVARWVAKRPYRSTLLVQVHVHSAINSVRALLSG